MATSISMLADKLKKKTDWQRTPTPLYEDDYIGMVIYGIERMYVDTGRASAYDTSFVSTDDETGEVLFEKDLPIDEQAYVLLCAQIQFFQQVAADVNNIVGYTTDALTVTNADKPYANIKDTIATLDNERRITYYKMARFTML